MEANSSKSLVQAPKFKGNAFLSLELLDANGNRLADNFYWLSDETEVYDWEATNWVHTPMKSYPNFKGLNAMKPSELGLSTTRTGSTIQVKIENRTETIALFNQLKLHDGSGNWIVPAYYSDNYFSILPRETKILQIKLNSEVGSKPLQLELSGWNSNVQNVQL